MGHSTSEISSFSINIIPFKFYLFSFFIYSENVLTAITIVNIVVLIPRIYADSYSKLS